MTDVPPPVPPEIVRRAAETIRSQHWDGTGCGTNGTSACSRCYGPSPADADEVAYDVLAAVYGDIVEAARRDALAGMGRCDDRAPSLAPDVPSEFCVREPGHGGWHETEDGMHWINEAPRTAPAATVSDQGADPRIPGTDEAQKRSEGHEWRVQLDGRDEPYWSCTADHDCRLVVDVPSEPPDVPAILALVAAQAEQIAVVRALCDRGDFERDAFAASVGSGGAPTGEAWIRVRDLRAALDGTEATP